MQMMFRTAFDGDSEVFVSEAGKPYLEEYEYEVDKDGVRKLVKTDRTIDVFSQIQADAPSTDINLLMKRFALGDKSALDIKQGMYFDASEMPKTYAELFDRNEKARQFFEKQPVELKEMFNNSYEQFFTEMGSKGFNEKVEKYNDMFTNHDFEVVEDAPKTEVGKEIEY